jgi:AcrR family transcriptional regulator
LVGAQLQQVGSEVPAHEVETRERLLVAIIRAVADHGYAGFTVERAMANAKVSRETFAEHFGSREQALVAAQEDFLDHLWNEVAVACGTVAEWPLQVRAALHALIAALVETSGLARAFGVEATAASLVAAECQLTTLDRFAAMLSGGRNLYPLAASLPVSTERVVVGGVASILLDRLFAEDPGALPTLEPQLVELVLLPYLGAEEARRIATA